MKRIALFGGSFDPIHAGHLMLAQYACHSLRLDRVIFIPSSIAPHKNRSGIADERQRLDMVRLATRGNTKFQVSDCEIKRRGKSYSIDTVNHLRKIFPAGTMFFFLIGGDNAETLHRWKDIETLRKMVTFVAVNRPDANINKSKVPVKEIHMPESGLSSSWIRKSIKSGADMSYFVPASVARYIKKNRIYR